MLNKRCCSICKI